MNTFDSKTHAYFIDGKRATGVTTVIGVLAKPQLVGWAAKMATDYVSTHIKSGKAYTEDELAAIFSEAKDAHTRKKEDAGVKGTSAHALVEEWIKTQIDRKASTTDFTPIQKFVDWAKENVDHFLFSERKMFDKELFIAGTADFAYVGKDGMKYMADLKTSSGIYGIEYWLQTAAYRMLAEKEGDEAYDACVVVRMGKKGINDFEAQYLYDYDTAKNAFLSCLTIYRAQAALAGMAVKK